MSDRRTFLKKAAGASVLLAGNTIDLPEARRATPPYFPLVIPRKGYTPAEVPEGKRIPFGWSYFSVPVQQQGIVLQTGKLPEDTTGTLLLRLMIALDTRDKREISVSLAGSGHVIGKMSVWYAAALQIFECTLTANARQISEEGIRLMMEKGNAPLFLLATSESSGSHLLAVSKLPALSPSARFLQTLHSDRSLHPFGWMEGCVLDGLRELALQTPGGESQKALDRHLKYFVPDEQNLIYETPNTLPADNTFTNLESGLPFVAIAGKYPNHTSTRRFLHFCEQRIENGKVKSNSFTTEGCYTLAYPLAAVAKLTGQKQYYEHALTELEERIRYLTDDRAVYQRVSVKEGTKGFRNWGRGYTWFLLGMVRTAAVIRPEANPEQKQRLEKIRATFVYYAEMALRYQQPDHSWYAYLDLSETFIEFRRQRTSKIHSQWWIQKLINYAAAIYPHRNYLCGGYCPCYRYSRRFSL